MNNITTLFLFVAAYLFCSTTLATPVAQNFDFLFDDYGTAPVAAAATINNNNNNIPNPNLPQDFFGIEGGGLLQQQELAGEENGNDASPPPPPFLTGDDATKNYLQAQVPSLDTFSNFGGGCPSSDLYCCRGGSGTTDSLITDEAFDEKCIPCMFFFFLKKTLPACLPITNTITYDFTICLPALKRKAASPSLSSLSPALLLWLGLWLISKSFQ